MLTDVESEFTECWSKDELSLSNKEVFDKQSFLYWITETHKDEVVVVEQAAYASAAILVNKILVIPSK